MLVPNLHPSLRDLKRETPVVPSHQRDLEREVPSAISRTARPVQTPTRRSSAAPTYHEGGIAPLYTAEYSAPIRRTGFWTYGDFGMALAPTERWTLRAQVGGPGDLLVSLNS